MHRLRFFGELWKAYQAVSKKANISLIIILNDGAGKWQNYILWGMGLICTMD